MKMKSVGLLFLIWFMTLNSEIWLCGSQSTQDGPRSTRQEKIDEILSKLILGCTSPALCDNRPEYRHVEYSGYDGFYNNLAKPSQGGIDTPLMRILPAAYKDGVYEPAYRPANPLNVSQKLMAGENGMTSKSGNTAFLLFFGQQVVEEVLDAQGSACPPEYFNIKIPEDHEYYKKNPKVKELPLLRTRYDMRTGFSPNNPRQQLNEITPYIDGGLIYGTSKAWADLLRTNKDGKLVDNGKLAGHSDPRLGEDFPAENSQRMPLANPPPPSNHTQFIKRHYTANIDRFFKLGNPRGNENPFLLTFGIFWFRWHNAIAGFLNKKYKDWEGERIFNEARKWVIATQQSITMYDWLQKYLKTNLDDYSTTVNGIERGGYDPSIDPQISQIFQSAAMRFGHTLVTSGVYLRKKESEGCGTDSFNFTHSSERVPTDHNIAVRTCNSFWRSPELFTSDPKNFDNFLMGLSSQSTEAEDNIIVEDLRGRVFGPLEFSRRDLMAVNIQRARDHGLPDYNTARKYFGLQELDSLEPEEYIAKTGTGVDPEVLLKLQEVYNNESSLVDIWPGGLLETNRGPGQLFSAVIRNQFERIRAGDRFWFENKKNGLFSQEEIERIRNIKIFDIIQCVSDITNEDIQEDPFTAPRETNMPLGPTCISKLTTQRDCTVYDPIIKAWSPNTTCKYLPPLSRSNLETCTPPQTFDYFSGSEVSYILTFVFTGLVILVISVSVNTWVFIKERKKKKFLLATIKVKPGQFKCKERISFLERRVVILNFDPRSSQILVKSNIGKILRVIELAHLESITIYHTENLNRIIIKVENHYDLYLLINTTIYARQILDKIEEFCHEIKKTIFIYLKSMNEINSNIITFKDREEQLKHLLDMVLNLNSKNQTKCKTENCNNVSKLKLTKSELANALGMTTDNSFFKQFFYLMDKDQNGFVTFQEFMSVMTMFSNGTDEEKAYLFFNIYDLDHSGYLTVDDFKMFIESNASPDLEGKKIDQIVESMLSLVNLRSGEKLSFEQFYEIFKSNKIFQSCLPTLGKMQKPLQERWSIYGDLPEISVSEDEFKLGKEHLQYKEEDVVEDIVGEGSKPHTYSQEIISRIVNYIRSNEKVIFWGCLYTIVMILIFAERAYYYSVEREHFGLRRIAGYGVTVTRGAASAMMFTYSSLLVTMCRNIFSFLRSYFLHKYYPFDEMIGFHKYIGWWALFWTIVHVIGHSINFYHISTQPPSDLLCVFRNFFRQTHVLPKFHYWCWQTITGLTGIFLTIQLAVIYIFAIHARKHLYQVFWWTHNTYPLFYFLIVLHGSGQLVQAPFFHLFFLGPCILFCFDKMISMSRKHIKINVLGAKHLPSNVTLLRIQRPNNFSYRSGQWMRIASVGISNMEYHPFTISSAPHERDLTLHIRGVGPWTNTLRKVYPDFENIKVDKTFKYPEVYIDGPFGEGHQTWWKYEVVVLVGGGIGVTPFASILKDIAFRIKQPINTFKCKKVIFLWVTRSQKQFEWMTDILRQVEEADQKSIIRIHIFITQFKSKYDFRTTMLFHAERHFQKLSGTSMFTGLKAITHFSRPNFSKVFQAIKEQYNKSPIIAVFTCGSLALSSSVDSGCREVNKGNDPVFKHYYENY